MKYVDTRRIEYETNDAVTGRSAEAAKKLAGMGYSNIYDFGGIMDWPYEAEK